mmetsp:Transcript_9722/g.24952  ORF Transcript_9722/g.24952 Transcript_9722/m.24952 type:complete len:320 (+) Transcript_9722:62-1021(+)
MMTMYWKDIRIIKASFILYFSWVPALYDSLQRPEHLHAGVEQRQHDAVLDGVVEGRVLLLNVLLGIHRVNKVVAVVLLLFLPRGGLPRFLHLVLDVLRHAPPQPAGEEEQRRRSQRVARLPLIPVLLHLAGNHIHLKGRHAAEVHGSQGGLSRQRPLDAGRVQVHHFHGINGDPALVEVLPREGQALVLIVALEPPRRVVAVLDLGRELARAPDDLRDVFRQLAHALLHRGTRLAHEIVAVIFGQVLDDDVFPLRRRRSACHRPPVRCSAASGSRGRRGGRGDHRAPRAARRGAAAAADAVWGAHLPRPGSRRESLSSK